MYACMCFISRTLTDASLARLLPSDSPLQATGVHSFSAASAGAIATMATHPFDVIKVCRRLSAGNCTALRGYPDKDAGQE